MARWTTTQRDSMLRQVSDTTVAVAAGALLGTAVVIGYAVVTHPAANAAEASGDQSGSSTQTSPQQGFDPNVGDDQGGLDQGGQVQGGQVQGGLVGGAPTTSGGS